MEIIGLSDEFKNSKTLLVIVGALLLPFFNSVDTLFMGLFKIAGLSFGSVMKLTILFHGLVIVCLLALGYWALVKRKSGQVKIVLSPKKLKWWGIVSFLIVFSAGAMAFYMKLNQDTGYDLQQVRKEELTPTDLGYHILLHSALSITTNFLLFIIYFVIIFGRKRDIGRVA